MDVALVVSKVNDYGVGVWHFYADTKGVNELGHAYSTYHPTIPYEVFTDNPIDSTRVNSIEEAKEWLNNRSIMQNFTPVVDRIVNWE